MDKSNGDARPAKNRCGGDIAYVFVRLVISGYSLGGPLTATEMSRDLVAGVRDGATQTPIVPIPWRLSAAPLLSWKSDQNVVGALAMGA
jgi:hypothetical protein